MSDEAVESVAPVTAGEPSAGQLLRKAREASGLHVAALAVAMKVPVKKLEALESDRFGELPDAVFVRALAASVCRTLKVDPAPILNKLPQSVVPKFETDDRGINMPFRSPGLYYGNSLKSFASKPAALAVLGLLVAALVVVFFPESHSSVRNVLTPAPAEAPAPQKAEAPVPVGPQVSTPPVAELANAHVPANTGKLVDAELAKPLATEAAVVAKPAASAATGAVVNGVMTFRAKSSAWVRVSDSKGVVQFEKTLSAGESATAGGELPLAVVIGNVGATEVEVRGQAFSLDAFNINNVARFEVK